MYFQVFFINSSRMIKFRLFPQKQAVNVGASEGGAKKIKAKAPKWLHPRWWQVPSARPKPPVHQNHPVWGRGGGGAADLGHFQPFSVSRGCWGAVALVGGVLGPPKWPRGMVTPPPTPSPPSRCGAMRETMVFTDKWEKNGCLYCFYPKRWLTGLGGLCLAGVFSRPPGRRPHPLLLRLQL